MRGIHRWPVNSPHKRPVTRKIFPFDDVIMNTNTYPCPDLRWITLIQESPAFICSLAHQIVQFFYPDQIRVLINFLVSSMFWNYILHCVIGPNLWIVLLTRYHPQTSMTLLWCHNGRDDVSYHQPQDCLVNCLFRRRSKKTKLSVTGLCADDSPVTGEFPLQKASNGEMFPFDDVIMNANTYPCPEVR